MEKFSFIEVHTRKTGLVDVRQKDISMITLPSLRYFLTFRGYGSLITLKNGKTLHVKEEPYEVRRLIEETKEE